ncbi:metabotropic glutamate receptor-like protein, partial [Dinothrombium tinctorium]
MLFALDKINNDTKLLPGIKLGSIILDTCSSDSYALNQSLEFIRASINTVESSAFKCEDGSNPTPRYEMKTITGVVGGSYSEVSLQVANLLRLFRIPQVSYASTGTSLSDKTRYDFFARTVPPDTFQALALVDLVQNFNWSYVSFVSSEGQYGDSGMTAFLREARARNICVAINEKVPHSANETVFDQILKSLMKKPNAKVVVLFVRMEDARGLLLAAQRANQPNFFTWIASDGWGKEEKLVLGVEEVAQGALTVELQSSKIEEFDKYMKSLTPFNNKRNPWFKEYWEDTFECKLPSEDEEDASFNVERYENVTMCSPNIRIDESVYNQESKVQFVIDAVYAFAHALHNAWKDKCFEVSEICKELKEMDGGDFYKYYLLNVSFT